MVKGDDGKTEDRPEAVAHRPDGWIPICEKNLPFELTASVPAHRRRARHARSRSSCRSSTARSSRSTSRSPKSRAAQSLHGRPAGRVRPLWGEKPPDMELRIDVYHHFPGDDRVMAKLGQIDAKLDAVSGAQQTMSATMQQVLDDLDQIKTQAGTYIAGRDAIDVQLRADLAAARAGTGISPAEQQAIDAAFTKAEEAKALLVPPVVTTPAVGANPV
jgi:hypothetical protein